MQGAGTTVRGATPPLPEVDRNLGRSTAAVAEWSTGSIVLIAVLFVVTVLGVYLRLWIVGHAPINSDEAVVGLMARGILHGHLTTFFWGQSYGGVEPYVVALVFAVFGQSAFSLTLAPALLSLVAAVVVWRIGRRVFGKLPGLVAAALSWIWGESSLWNATREYGFHEVELVIGLLVLLQVVRIRAASGGGKDDSLADWFGVGALVGLGWWAGPEIVYFALPGAVFLLLTFRHRPVAAVVGRLGAAVSGLVLCALPWIVASFTDGFATLRASGGAPLPGNNYFDRLSTFFSHVLPMVLGLRVEGAGVWEGSQSFGVAIYIVLLLALVAALILVGYRLAWARPLVAMVVAYPLLYAAFPSAWFWNDGRYAISLTPLLALVLVGGLWTAVSGNWARWVTVAVLVAATASTLVAFNDSFGALSSLSKLTTWGTHPNSLSSSLGQALEAHRVDDVYAGYWVAYDLQFASSGRISVMSFTNDRNLAEARSVQAAPKAGWIFVNPADLVELAAQFEAASGLDPGTLDEPGLESWLVSQHLSFEKFTTGPFTVVVPSRNVVPPSQL